MSCAVVGVDSPQQSLAGQLLRRPINYREERHVVGWVANSIGRGFGAR
jgi:hypothetical protein